VERNVGHVVVGVGFTVSVVGSDGHSKFDDSFPGGVFVRRFTGGTRRRVGVVEFDKYRAKKQEPGVFVVRRILGWDSVVFRHIYVE